MMRPYPGRNLTQRQSVYNYRLSRACRVIKNSFGILASRWRICQRPIIAEPNHVVIFTKAAVALHNFLHTTESSVYCPLGYVDAEDGCGSVTQGSWKQDTSPAGLQHLHQLGGNQYTTSAYSIRDTFADYYRTAAGEVHWQYENICRTN